MRKYAPAQRVDQFELYQTSVHGKRLAAGDAAVATCIDCHSVHDIRSVKEALSPVHPLRLPRPAPAATPIAQKMAKYKIPTNQFSEYRTSVHWEALSKRGDLSAPTCASCHGNHGAKPPQVESVSAVCGSCHVLFESSTKRAFTTQSSPARAAAVAAWSATPTTRFTIRPRRCSPVEGGLFRVPRHRHRARRSAATQMAGWLTAWTRR